VSQLGTNVRGIFSDAKDAIAEALGFPEEETGGAVATSPDCYDPANVNTIGTAEMTGCVDMLIVDTDMLRDAGYFGNKTFRITHNGTDYTFENDDRNIFTGQVTYMSHLFARSDFNGDIEYWDTSSVTRMSHMFEDATAFNGDLTNWDVSSVIEMDYMFHGATAFNGDVTEWTPPRSRICARCSTTRTRSTAISAGGMSRRWKSCGACSCTMTASTRTSTVGMSHR
jgi:surface protein